jgi:hypothetical protein
MDTDILYVAVLLTLAYSIYGRDNALVAHKGGLGWELTAAALNVLALTIIFAAFCGIALVLS